MANRNLANKIRNGLRRGRLLPVRPCTAEEGKAKTSKRPLDRRKTQLIQAQEQAAASKGQLELSLPNRRRSALSQSCGKNKTA